MKKLTTYFCLLFFCILPIACIDDQGNYDYIDESSVLPVQIEGLCSDTTILKGETLRLSPIIVNDDPSRYTYSWYIMDYVAAGFLPRQWDLGEEKNLEWTANLDAAQYRLNFRIYDKQLDLFTRHEIVVTITAAPMTTGWYILKDNESETDIDYISSDNERYNDILAGYQEAIPGTAISMAYQNGRYYHTITNEDGSVTTKSGLSAYHILTSEDIRTYDAKDFTLYKTFEEEFYAAPDVCRPQVVAYSSNVYLLNDGKIHKISVMSANIGKFGAAFPGTYDLAGFLLPYGASDKMVFDLNTHSFFKIGYNGSDLVPIEEAATTSDTLALQNMDYELQCACSHESSSTFAFTMKNVIDNNYILLSGTRIYDPSTYTYSVSWQNISSIPESSRLCSTRIMAQAKATSFFYFAVDGNVYSYVISQDTSLEQRERERLSFPGETVTNLTYISNFEIDNNTTTEALAVLTSQNGIWKLRVYALLGESTPDLNTTPLLEYEGNGNGRYLLYRGS